MRNRDLNKFILRQLFKVINYTAPELAHEGDILGAFFIWKPSVSLVVVVEFYVIPVHIAEQYKGPL